MMELQVLHLLVLSTNLGVITIAPNKLNIFFERLAFLEPTFFTGSIPVIS
jgi:hypothetical protein